MYDKQHNPNAGENQVHNAEGGSPSTSDSAGVGDGLSSLETISVKDAEGVCQGQRPEGKITSSGSFKIGV